MLHGITMDHVTQHMPTSFPFKNSTTESSRQTQHEPVGILRQARLGDDLYEYIRAHSFAAVITRILSGSWKLTVMHLPPKCQAEQLVACNNPFLLLYLNQSKQEKQKLTRSTDHFDSFISVDVILS